MYDIDEDRLFGHDCRHRPSLIPRLLTARRWEGSRGRLALDKFNRAQDKNMSEYAVSTIGGLPSGYVIVNADSMEYDAQKAIKVSNRRVAIPVKEYARQQRLSILEQWELMNPSWVGTYFGERSDWTFNGRRPNLKHAIKQAKDEGRYIEFAAMFWLAWDEHWEALNRMTQNKNRLQKEADKLKSEIFNLGRKISQIESDIHYHRTYDKYHIKGINVYAILKSLKLQYSNQLDEYLKIQQKARKLSDFLESLSL